MWHHKFNLKFPLFAIVVDSLNFFTQLFFKECTVFLLEHFKVNHKKRYHENSSEDNGLSLKKGRLNIDAEPRRKYKIDKSDNKESESNSKSDPIGRKHNIK